MGIEIENLNVTVRVTTAPRAVLSDVEQRQNRNEAGQQVLVMRPPKPHATTVEAQVPADAEDQPEVAAGAAAGIGAAGFSTGAMNL